MISYSSEFLALIILFIIFISIVEQWKANVALSRLYIACLVINGLAALTNMAAGITIYYAHVLPLWINLTINTVYFLLNHTVILAYISYFIYYLLAHTASRATIKSYIVSYSVFYLAAQLMLLINLPTGIMFYFNDNLEYCHGPVWFIGYILLGIALIYSVFISVRHRKYTTRSMRRIVHLSVAVLVFLGGFRVLFPSLLVESLMGSVVALIFFIHFQSASLETDTLTKLKNLDAFTKALRTALDRKDPFHVIIVSLRNFSAVNSTFGYDTGSDILFEIAEWLTNYYRGIDVFRYSSVSFAVILPAHDLEDKDILVHSLIDNFPASWQHNGQYHKIEPCFVDLSCDSNDATANTILDQLDYARTQIKNTTLNHLHFDKTLTAELNRRKYLIDYIRDSIHKKRFELYYQPLYCAEKCSFPYAEALLRLKDENGVPIPPPDIIKIATESGYINQLNQLIIENVCAFLGHHKNLPITSVSVNTTVEQLQDPMFAEDLMETMKRYGVPDGRLSLEVTEELLFSPNSTIQLSLFKLRYYGFVIMLDDFGTGYSNFSSLLKYHFDKIKLDKSLLYSENEKDLDLIETLITLFHKNGQKVVIEGIETEEQKNRVLSKNADMLQGYLFSKPLPEKEFLYFISQ